MHDAKDHWSSKSYSDFASFVPALATKVFSYLDPQPHDIILDIGCGDGLLTGKIAQLCKRVTGVDNSPSFIQSAIVNVKSAHPNADFSVADCRRVSVTACETETLDIMRVFQDDKYDKVFSNAAMHWILRDDGNRVHFFSDVLDLLKPGGKFVFEMGGHGNVTAMHTALIAVLHLKYGIPLERIRNPGDPKLGAGDPWFFPSVDWARQTLEGAGFEVDLVEEEYRPTRMASKGQDAGEGLKGYVRLMGARFLDLLDGEDKREAALGDVCEILTDPLRRIEDDSRWLGFVRLRAIARKPVPRRPSARRMSGM